MASTVAQPSPEASASARAGSPPPSPRHGSPFDARFLIRLFLVALAIAGLAVAAALAVASLLPTTYGGRVDVAYITGQDTADDARERILNTQREIVVSRAVLGPVARSAGRPLADLEGAVDVEVGLDDVMQITVGDERRERAQALAQAVADRYVGVARELSPEQRRAQALVREELAGARRAARGAPDSVAYSYEDRVNRLRDRLLELQVAGLTDLEPRVLARAYVLDAPLSPRPARAAAAGLAVGLLLATMAAAVLARRRWLDRGGER